MYQSLWVTLMICYAFKKFKANIGEFKSWYSCSNALRALSYSCIRFVHTYELRRRIIIIVSFCLYVCMSLVDCQVPILTNLLWPVDNVGSVCRRVSAGLSARVRAGLARQQAVSLWRAAVRAAQLSQDLPSRLPHQQARLRGLQVRLLQAAGQVHQALRSRTRTQRQELRHLQVHTWVVSASSSASNSTYCRPISG